MIRTNYCGLIDENYINKEITVIGWVHKRRDLGGLIFIDLRDREGILQIVVEPGSKPFNLASSLKTEFIIQVQGTARARLKPNLELKTGQVELIAHEISLINTASSLPILVDDPTNSDINRMTHRIIDLRSGKMQHNLRLRYEVTKNVRQFLDQEGFMDIETPFLTRSTPEGARDFLVPSRLNKGEFYALPQSPQLFKQLLMVAGFDKYYQIVRCFRDEDLRSERQPEFTQIDIEASFVTEENIRTIAENMVRSIFKNVLNVELPKFPIMQYKDAMNYYGVDKPDLRIPLKFVDLTQELKNSEFKVFRQVADLNGRIVAIKIPAHITLSRKELEEYATFVSEYGAKGLPYIKINDISLSTPNALQSPITKFLTESEIKTILTRTEADNNDILLFGADSSKVVNEAMGALRIKIGHSKGLIEDSWRPLWVVDFPMFEYNEEEKRYTACHHPFTSPHDDHIELLSSDPEKCLAKAYDMVLNGWEIGGGSIRIHDPKVQSKVFSALNITEMDAINKFGFLLENLQYGAPPHGGIAFGLDRIVALMCNVLSIRDVIAFPKTTRGQCLLTKAPNIVDDSQLSELGIKLI